MQLLSYIQGSKAKYVVEYASLQTGDSYALTKASIVSGELSTEEQLLFTSLENLGISVLKNPVTLVVNTNKVLTRKVIAHTKTTQILSDAFPNLELDDFYYQIYTTEKNAFVSVVRKEYIEGIITEFEKAKITLTNFLIGPSHIAGALPFLKESNVETLSSSVDFEPGTAAITAIQAASVEEYKIFEVEGQAIKSSHLTGVGVLINQLLAKFYVGNVEEKNIELKKAYREQQFFKNTLVYGIGFLLCILLINAFMFNRKFSEIQLLQEEKLVFDNHKKQLEETKTTVKKKEAIVQSILNTGFSKSSFFIDRIVQLVPVSILLNQINYQPLARSIKKNKNIELDQKVLKIKGTSNNKKEFNNWLTLLEDLTYVNNVVIEEYGSVKGKKSDFEIHLNLKENESEK